MSKSQQRLRGVVTKLLAAEGATIPVGTPLVEIDTSKTAATNGVAKTSSAPADAKVAPRQARGDTNSAGAPQTNGVSPSRFCRQWRFCPRPRRATSTEVLASPQARRVARELEADLALVRGSGPNGLILLKRRCFASSNGESAPTPAAYTAFAAD